MFNFYEVTVSLDKFQKIYILQNLAMDFKDLLYIEVHISQVGFRKKKDEEKCEVHLPTIA